MSVYIRIHTCVVGRAVCEVEVGGRKRGESKKNSKTKRDSTQRQREQAMTYGMPQDLE